MFDSSKQRAEGTELKQFIKKGPQSKSLGQTSGLRGNDAPVGIRRAGAVRHISFLLIIILCSHTELNFYEISLIVLKISNENCAYTFFFNH